VTLPWDDLYFWLGMASGLAFEALIGAFITAPLAFWWFRRKWGSLLEDFLADKEAMAMVRQKFVAGLFGGMKGGMGGLPMLPKLNMSNLLRVGGALMLQRMMGGAAAGAEAGAEQVTEEAITKAPGLLGGLK
jgi:hypothetical protein